jgi:hypothetical protein
LPVLNKKEYKTTEYTESHGGKMRDRIKNSVSSVVKKFWPIGLVVIFLLFAGIMAITQEAEEDSGLDDILGEDMAFDFSEDGEGEPPAEWIPPGLPRWFRSNAGGMTLEEIPSRLAALRNEYALVIDYVSPHELEEPRIIPFYRTDYAIEIRILYNKRKETRRQWLFRDEEGVTRLNAVFLLPPGDRPQREFAEEESLDEDFIDDDFIDEDFIAEKFAETALAEEPLVSDELAEIALSAMPDLQLSADLPNKEAALSVGFIEVFNEKAQITEDYWLFDDDSEILVTYVYNENTLVNAETRETSPDGESRLLYIDSYRYNRSYSLRHVEREYHEAMRLEPVRLTFPGRVLDAASDRNFFSDKLPFGSDFMGSFLVGEGFRILYETDNRGRILTQTMVDSKNATLWVIKNTWSGDRIIAMVKKEGEDEKLTEYEFDDARDRVVQRDIHNGVLERVVYIEGLKETEELYLDGVLVLRAHWEDGKKISEERVRRR